MDQLLDTGENSIKDKCSTPLVDLVEAYILRKRNDIPIITRNFGIKLKEMGYSPDQIEELLIEMHYDADSELRSGIGSRKAKRNLIVGLVIGSLALVISITVTLGKTIVLPVSTFALGILVISRAYYEIGMVKKRKKRRFLKYKNWSLEGLEYHYTNIPNLSDKNRYKQDLNSDHFFQPPI